MRLVSFLLICVILSFTTLFSCGQGEGEGNIVLLTINNDRGELAKTINLLNLYSPKLICVNVDLKYCDEGGGIDTSSNHFLNSDSLIMRTEIRPDESDKILAREFETSSSLLLPSEIRPFGTGEYITVTGCNFLYPDGVNTGFINLIRNEKAVNQIDKFQISNTFGKMVRYHFAVNIAMVLSPEKTHTFINTHKNITSINFDSKRKFKSYHFDDFKENGISSEIFEGKVVIVSVVPNEENLIVKQQSDKTKLIMMSSSEIFANIASQIVGN